MTQLPFKQVDVFTGRPFSGNPVAVVHDADGLTDGQMAAFARWCRRNVHAHKVAGYASVTLSTKPGMAAPPGDVGSAQMRAVADWAERWFPDAFVIAMLGVVLVFMTALLMGEAPGALIRYFGDGFWSLIPLTMQMAIIIIAGALISITLNPLMFGAISVIASSSQPLVLSSLSLRIEFRTRFRGQRSCAHRSFISKPRGKKRTFAWGSFCSSAIPAKRAKTSK